MDPENEEVRWLSDTNNQDGLESRSGWLTIAENDDSQRQSIHSKFIPGFVGFNERHDEQHEVVQE